MSMTWCTSREWRSSLARANEAAQNALETRPPVVQADPTTARAVFEAAMGACQAARVAADEAAAELNQPLFLSMKLR